MTSLLVPAKPMGRAKTRLAATLSAEARIALYTDMLRHVLRTAKQCQAIDQVWVVSRCPHVANLAASQQITFIPEPDLSSLAPDLQEVVDHGIGEVRRLQAAPILVVMGDLPHLTADDLAGMAKCLDTHRAVAAPDRHRCGTNGIGFAAHSQCSTRFGRSDSFQAHLRQFEHHGLATATWNSPGVALDIDTPDDFHFAQLRQKEAATAPNPQRP